MSTSFVGLLATQLLSVINDNVFRWLVIGIGKGLILNASNESAILMIGSNCFILPYLILAAPAGYLADRYSKRSVIVGCKAAELGIMLLGTIGVFFLDINVLFVAVALMGAQSALFSPAKLGSIPEMLQSKHISNANGLMGLSTVVATVIGMAIGNVLAEVTKEDSQYGWLIAGAVLLGLALVGWLASLLIRKAPAANPTRRFPWDAPFQTYRDLKTLAMDRPMLRVSLGMMFFWSIGMLAQLNIDQFATEGGALVDTDKTPLLACLVAGLGIGSLLAGLWSGGRVELGILPLGAFGVAAFAMLLFTVQGDIFQAQAVTASFVLACVFLVGLGFSAGLFEVPLSSYMQHYSAAATRGSILAAMNFLVFGGMFMMSIVFWMLRMPLASGQPLFTANQIFLLSGLFTLPVFAYIIWLLPGATIRFVVWLASRTIYRVRTYQLENVPAEGGALLVPNHVSWVDGVMVGLAVDRPIRVVAFAGNFQSRFMKWLAELFGVILILPKPKMIVKALGTARKALEDGELVCIFAEGAITRTGQVQSFKPGMMKIIKGTDAPVIPVYLDELWGSIFSFNKGRFFWKWPKAWPYPISIFFGAPIYNPSNVGTVRNAVVDLGATAVATRSEKMTQLPREFIRRCKQRKRVKKAADSSGDEVTGGMMLTRTLVLRRLLNRHVYDADEQFVGLLLPPSLAGVMANMAVALDRKTAVNLNYTVSSEVLNSCIEQCGIKHVLTSRRFMSKMNFDLDAELIYLEDLKDKPTTGDKLVSALQAFAMPSRMLEKSLGLDKITSEDVLTVIFTSGSTGTPKGVMLTYGNVGSNVEAIDTVVHLGKQDTLIGILPLFHSFGYTVTMWGAMALDVASVYHFNPLDGKKIGKLCEQHKGTVLLSTPTFLRTFLRRATKEQFETLDVVVAGAEKLPTELCDAFEEKFGVRPVEGYGATETSPLASVNVPPSRSSGDWDVDWKEGTVGRPVPGVTAKVIDPDSEEERPIGEEGMLLIKGPNIMKGYIGRDDLTEKVVKDGWYVTGDIAKLDDDGFIQITGRLSRFSKIGGEMVPHIKIEEVINQVLGANEEDGLLAAVTAVPDPKKGERLIVIHKVIDQSPDEVREALQAEGLPNIFIPSSDSFHQVDVLPLLGTGKLDLSGIKQTALDQFGDA